MILYETIDEGPLKTANSAAYGSGKAANSAIVPQNGGSIFLDHVDATLTADRGLTVNTDIITFISGKEVSYVDGVYKAVDREPEGSDPDGDA